MTSAVEVREMNLAFDVMLGGEVSIQRKLHINPIAAKNILPAMSLLGRLGGFTGLVIDDAPFVGPFMSIDSIDSTRDVHRLLAGNLQHARSRQFVLAAVDLPTVSAALRLMRSKAIQSLPKPRRLH